MHYLYQVRAKDKKGEYYVSQCVARNADELYKEYNALGLSVESAIVLYPLDKDRAMKLYAYYNELGILGRDERD